MPTRRCCELWSRHPNGVSGPASTFCRAAQENDPPVLDCATIEEFLTLDDDAMPDEDTLELDDDDADGPE